MQKYLTLELLNAIQARMPFSERYLALELLNTIQLTMADI